jgi:hypothetical protein
MRLVPDLEARLIRREVRIASRRFIRPEAAAIKPEGPFMEADFEERTGPTEYIVDVDALVDADGCGSFVRSATRRTVVAWARTR